MRKQFVNLLTWYILVFACINVVVVTMVHLSDAGCFESVITVAITNASMILIMRDVAIKHELVVSKRSGRHNEPIS